ncbi:MAG: hypothetical protein ACKPBT_10245 [Microcystis aeruginosa]
MYVETYSLVLYRLGVEGVLFFLPTFLATLRLRRNSKYHAMEQQTIEGTWEEILQHSAELAGQRVRLTILPDKSTNSSTTETLDQKLKGRVGRVHFQPSDLSERVGEAFTALLEAKDSSALNQ